MNIVLTVIELVIFALLIGGPAVAFVLYRNMKKRQERLTWEASQRYTTLEILAPKNNDKSPLAAEQMLASLHGIYREAEAFQYQMSFEIASHAQFIHFYVYIPTHLKDFVEGQIYAQYPTVEVKEVDDYASHDFAGHVVAGTRLSLTKPYVYPIKTFQSFDVDPMSAITAVLGKVGTEEQAWIQFVMRPVPDDWQLKGISFASKKRAGESLQPIPGWKKFVMSILKVVADLTRLMIGSSDATKPVKPNEKKLSSPEEAGVKGIETKLTKLGFETVIRIVAVANDELSARGRIEDLTGAYKQFNTTNLNGFRSSGVAFGEDPLEEYRSRRFPENGDILNIEELASLYHFPAVSVETPNIAWAGSKKGEPPANLPYEGQTPPEELTVFGETDFRNVHQRFGILRGDRRLHMYAIGKTGTGKSTLLENMIIDDIQKGKGVAVVDPHGDLIDHVLNFIPDHRINDIIYFNPADREFPVGFNLLESLDPDLKNIAASGLMSIFTKLWANVWSARMEYILRNTVLALLEYPGATFLEIMKLLVDPQFRKQVLTHVKDPVIRDFFLNEFERYDPKFRTEAIAPIQNKVGQFLSSDTIRNIVGQPKSSFDIRKAMDERKIILLDLSTGKIGEDNAALLGAMMITKIQLAAMTRVDTPEAERVDFYLYVDEFQNFATESFAKVLSEARKYRLNLVLTNQYIAQLQEPVAKAIFGNIGTLMSFRVGSADASALVKELEPVFDATDLVNLDNYHIYLKMSIDGVTRPAFSAKTLPPFKGANDNRDKIIDVSRSRYAKPREEVERSIEESGQKPSDSGFGPTSGSAGGQAGSVDDSEVKRGPKYRRLGKSGDGVVWYGSDEVPETGAVDQSVKVEAKAPDEHEIKPTEGISSAELLQDASEEPKVESESESAQLAEDTAPEPVPERKRLLEKPAPEETKVDTQPEEDFSLLSLDELNPDTLKKDHADDDEVTPIDEA